MIRELQCVSRLRAQGGTELAYIGRLGSLPGTSSLASSWALHTESSAMSSSNLSLHGAGQKRRLAGNVCFFRADGGLHTHDCGLYWQRAVCFRALSSNV
jgi:hypothetical protein